MLFAGSLIIQNAEVLLVQEAHEEAYGLWSLPMGSVDDGETVQSAAIRETKEESGFEVELGGLYKLNMTGKELRCLEKYNDKEIGLHIFEGRVVGGKLRKGDDILDAKWFRVSEIMALDLRGQWIINLISSKLERPTTRSQ